MSWSTTYKVICDLPQISLTNPQHKIILMTYDDLPPGYTRLELITVDTSKSNEALYSLHRENGTYYVSSRNTITIVCTIFSEPIVSPGYSPNMDHVGISSWMKGKRTILFASNQTTGHIKLDHG